MNLKTLTNTFFSRLICSLLVIVIFGYAAHAQPGTIDLTFNAEDIGFGAGVGASNTVRAVALQPDGKIIIGGAFVSYHGNTRNRLARLHPDGLLDTDFQIGTGANNDVRVVVVQPDGSILIGGNFTTYNGIPRNRMARVMPSGALDTSFDPGTGANGIVNSIELLPGGDMLVGGAFTAFNGSEFNYLVRLNSDGSIDNEFNPGTGPNGAVQAITTLTGGKLLIGGAFTTYNGTARNRIARLNADGSLDTTFDPGTGASGTVNAIKEQPDGKVAIGGAFTTYNGTARSRIALLNPDGSLDTGFFPGTGASSTVHSIVNQPEGRILIGGEFITYNGTSRSRLARLNPDGRLDNTFEAGAGGIVYSIAPQNDSRILIGGAFTAYDNQVRNRITRITTNGSLDEEFDPGVGANGIVYASGVRPDGKVMIGGAFTAYNGTPVNHVARLLANGTLDNSFQTGAGAGGDVRALAVLPDGKTYIAGNFTTYRGVSRNYIARLNADGSLDNSFDPNAGANGIVYAIALQPDGKILIGGAFTSYNNTPRARLARLNANGTLDTGFDPGTGASGIVYALALQGDKLIVGGAFTTVNGTARNRVARLNANGSHDTDFSPGTGANADVRTVAVQPNGKIFIGGNFTTYNATGRNRVARLNNNGALDTEFVPGTGASALVYSSFLQENGKILIGGDFATYNGISRNRFARLNADGSLDTGFDTGTGASGTVQTISRQPDGNVLIGGAFTSYNGVGRNRFARIQAEAIPLYAASQLAEGQEVQVYPNPSRGFMIVSVTETGSNETLQLKLYNALGQLLLRKTLSATEARNGIRLSTAAWAAGIYYLTTEAGGRIATKKLVITD